MEDGRSQQSSLWRARPAHRPPATKSAFRTSSLGEREIIPSTLKLSFDSCLVDDRPYQFYFPLVELVEHVLGEGDLPPIDLKAKEISSWRAVKSEPARDARRLTDQELNVEMKVRISRKSFSSISR